jgi:hypothetical protein
VAARHAAAHLHIPALPSAYDRRMWSIDRLHQASAAAGCSPPGPSTSLRPMPPVGRRPSLEPTSAPPTTVDRAVWMATRRTRWLLARGTDLVPARVGMALTEWSCGAGQRSAAIRPAAASARGSRVRS